MSLDAGTTGPSRLGSRLRHDFPPKKADLPMKSLRRCTLLALALLVFCFSATAGNSQDTVLTYPADVAVPISFTLLTRQGKVGRDNAIYDNYRPQVRFSGESKDVMCAVRISKAQEKIEPGETATVSLSCIEQFHVLEKDRSFIAYEGGRKVAEGILR
ncbi:hypothetical protein [uncultured Xanthomonas sp.]|uniref:hypothetical protein n=1 Tax=uncultured Xanthomonas sp. TaxID=152831 RepID=UPI0025E6AF6F|nr:hypothetical protein [uncultured Xanthomonas sp.]